MSAFDPEAFPGGYVPGDGTIEFYGRVNALLRPEMTVLDLGAGVGAWWTNDQCAWRRSLRTIKGKVTRYIGADVDPAVLTNPTTDENLIIEDGRIPLVDGSCDILICDYVLEHLDDPATFEKEVRRVLRPGGVFCGRTPHVLNYVSLGARVVANRAHGMVVSRMQPGRRESDFFPTFFRANSRRTISAIWSSDHWEDNSYAFTAQPTYHFGSRALFQILAVAHKLLPREITGNIFFFLQRQ